MTFITLHRSCLIVCVGHFSHIVTNIKNFKETTTKSFHDTFPLLLKANGEEGSGARCVIHNSHRFVFFGVFRVWSHVQLDVQSEPWISRNVDSTADIRIKLWGERSKFCFVFVVETALLLRKERHGSKYISAEVCFIIQCYAISCFSPHSSSDQKYVRYVCSQFLVLGRAAA